MRRYLTQHWQTVRGQHIERWILARLTGGASTARRLAEAGRAHRVSQAGVRKALERLVEDGRIVQSAKRVRADGRWPAWVYTVAAEKVA